jgi:hypothetical protein
MIKEPTTNEHSFGDWLTNLSIFVFMLAGAATVNAYFEGGIDQIVALHSPNSKAKVISALLLMASIFWLLLKPRLNQINIRRLTEESTLQSSRAQVCLLNLRRKLPALIAPFSVIAALSLFTFGYLQTLPKPVYALVNLYTNEMVEFNSMENCKAFTQKRFGKSDSTKLCFEK